MTEEEKKAVETVDKIIKRMEENEEYLRKQKNYLEGLLGDKVRKIIKLEEEIKELKSNSIPKDKIKERIEELNNDIKRNVTNMGKAEKANERNLAKAIHHYISSLNIVKEELKKLLEEE